MVSTTKPLVLVISGAGETGVSVLQGLAKAGLWVRRLFQRSQAEILKAPFSYQNLATTVRPGSMDRAEVPLLRDLGVEIHPIDWRTAGPEKLAELFQGVHTVISTVFWSTILEQKQLVDAAKSANVQRFIPGDFGTACPPGVMQLRDNVCISFHLVSSVTILRDPNACIPENRDPAICERIRVSLYVCRRRSLDASLRTAQVER